MISYDAAIAIITSAASALAPRSAPLHEALGAAAARETRSSAAVPSFDNAAMDGFALRSAETAHATPSAPVVLEIAGSIAAGRAPPARTPPGSAWEIMTGAPMPADCDAVLPLESAATRAGTASRPATLLVAEAVVAGRNRRDAGTDFAPGDVLLRGGDRIGATAVMALAAAGFDALPVIPPPRVAVLTTGSELAGAGQPGDAGIIRDANGPYLAASLAALNLPLIARRSAPDDPGLVTAELAALAADCDVVLTTGGVSAGRLDFLPATVARIGGEVLFHKVAIRPGKPLLLARLPHGKLLFGLPGNPMAVAVGFRFFVLPAIRALMGGRPEQFLPARLREPVQRRPSLTFFAKALAAVDAQATLNAQVLPGQESFRISPLLQANCWAIVPAGKGEIAAGETLEVAPLVPTEFPARAC